MECKLMPLSPSLPKLTLCRMMAIACVVLTVFHPAYFFPPFAAFRRHK
jgi:hypothetical protein